MWCTHWYWTTQNPTGLACVILVVGCEMPQCVYCLGWVITRSQWRNSPTRAVPLHCHEVQHFTRKWARARGGTHPRKQCHSTATKFNICTSAIPYSTKPHRITQAPLGHGTESHKIKQQFYNILLGSGTEPHKIKQNPLFDFVWFGVVRVSREVHNA